MLNLRTRADPSNRCLDIVTNYCHTSLTCLRVSTCLNTEEPKLNLPGPFCTRLPRIQRGTSPQLPDTDTGFTFSSPHDLGRQKIFTTP